MFLTASIIKPSEFRRATIGTENRADSCCESMVGTDRTNSCQTTSRTLDAEIQVLTRSTACADFKLLQPQPRTQKARCGNEGGFQRRDLSTCFGTPACKPMGTSHSSPAAHAPATSCVSLSVRPGQCFDMCAAKTPAYPTMIPDATIAP